MTLNEQLLEFLDGTLSQDEEAELLHRLSVSPERRNQLRGFMQQKAIFARDRQSIQVPYQAEQKLWERLAPLMPVVPAVEDQLSNAASEAATPALETLRTIPLPITFFAKFFTGTSAAVGTVALVLGLGLGYVTGANNPATVSKVYVDNHAPASAQLPQEAPQQEHATAALQHSARAVAASRANTPSPAVQSMLDRAFETRSESNDVASSSVTPTFAVTPVPSGALDLANATTAIEGNDASFATADASAPLHTVSARGAEPHFYDRIGGEDGGIRPIFAHNENYREPAKTLLQRFEFSFSESFGRQYPNSVATNNTLPLITNSTIGAFFQVLSNSDALWVGTSVGTANITRKNLFTKAGNPMVDPTQNVLASDTVHSQTSYLAGYVQYRVPAFAAADLTFTGGYGLAGMGKMLMGELGMHYDVSHEVGLQFGLRAVRFSYDLNAEKADALRGATGPLVIQNGVEDASPSFNLELSTGLFFHF